MRNPEGRIASPELDALWRGIAILSGLLPRFRSMIDLDLDKMSRDQLVAEVKKLRDGIRQHRDSTGHDLCWHHPQLWDLLPEQIEPDVAVPAWPQFLRGCVRYRESLDKELPMAQRAIQEYDEPGTGPALGKEF